MTTRMIKKIVVALVVLVLLLDSHSNCSCHAFQVFPGRGRGATGQPTLTKDHQETLQRTLGIPDGLMTTLLNHNDDFSKRIWIVDNSGSMGMADGHALAHTKASTPTTTTSRWKELEETVLLHAQLSSALQQPTEFRLLNTPPGAATQGESRRKSSFRVGHDTMRKSLKQAQTVLTQHQPGGSTPLTESIYAIRKEIVELLPQLKADGTKVAVVIVTDGCNHNLGNLGQDEREIHEEVLQALQSLLRGLPVTVVVRLCTDYGPLIDLYNGLDGELDQLDVLDDYAAEAKEVYTHNPWLNYAMILHRMREMGQHSKLFDALDERTFTRTELLEFCQILFGAHSNLPDPNQDWKGFLKSVHQLQSKERMQFNPRTQELAPWIDIEGLSMLE
eukprot:scaffold2212_cov143-Cylindrotheca_fusiformis.AAC.12